MFSVNENVRCEKIRIVRQKLASGKPSLNKWRSQTEAKLRKPICK